MSMQRVQMLLEPGQRRKLAELAKAQGKSIAEVTRQAIDAGLEQIIQQESQERMRLALEAAERLRVSMRQRNGGPLNIDIIQDIQQMREARDEELICRGGL